MYFILTIIVSSVRVMNLYDGKTMIDIWMMGSYTFFSFVHKIVAPFYYAENLKAAAELGSSKYYLKNAWGLDDT